MPLVGTLLFCCLALQPEKAYTPATHSAWIAERLKTIETEIAAVESTESGTSGALADLGRALAEERKWQGKLNDYLPKAADKDMAVAFGSVRVAGLFDAYLTSAIFSLDGDSDSREMRLLLERKIAKLIQRR